MVAITNPHSAFHRHRTRALGENALDGVGVSVAADDDGG